MSPHRQHQAPPPSLTTANSSNSVSEAQFTTRAERAARPNPFANFGHFGVDGGLEGPTSTLVGTIASVKGEGGKRRETAPHLHGGSIEKDKGTSARDRDWEGRRATTDGTTTKFGSPPNAFLDRAERPTRRGGDVTVSAPRDSANGRERREEKKEGRAEEGGWRTAGGEYSYPSFLRIFH